MVEWKRERYRRDSVCGDLSSAVICHRIVADSPVDLKHSYQVNYRLVLPRDARNVICLRIDNPQVCGGALASPKHDQSKTRCAGEAKTQYAE